MNNEISSKSFSSVTASLAATIIPDTPIVSIACSTLSKITTTTTSTNTTPTPTPTPTSFEPPSKEIAREVLESEAALAAANNPMSDAPAKTAGAAATGAAAATVSILKKESSPQPLAGKTDEASVTVTNTANTNESTKTKELGTWEESHLKDLDDTCLKKLLDEAYSYKNPRDKENKSEIFLQLLQKAENEKEDQAFSFDAITSRFTRNSSSTTSNSHHHSHAHNHHHHHHHHHKQGGSLQDLGDAERNESLLDCDYNFGVGGQRTRNRHNHNSRQKKYSSVSSRQREGGSLPSNVNVTNCVGLLGTLEQPSFMHEVKALLGTGAATCATDGSGDCVIEMGEPIMEIHQQQQQILQSKGQDASTQGLPYYDRLDNIDMRIPRANIIGSMQSKTDFAPTSSQCYVDETVRFTTLERSGNSVGGGAASAGLSGANATIVGGAGGKATASAIDSKYLPLDENYKSCKSVLGGEKVDMIKTPATMYSTTKTITRQFDENGNALNEMYQNATIMNAAAAGGINATSSSSSAATTNSGQSQAKAKAKKKSQQERNTKTVDVESVAGYRGKDPVEVLVKYIESTGEDKSSDAKSGNNNSNSNKFNEKKKERKNKDKENKDKQHKMKKSNSLEELRSCAKIEVDNFKRSAATTENSVIMRNKSGGGKNKNNSSSTADINKNFEAKELSATAAVGGGGNNKTVTNTVVAAAAARKGERRSWGTEELQYLGESNNANEEKIKERKTSKNKEKDNVIEKEKEKEKDKEIKEPKERSTLERNSVEKNSTYVVAECQTSPVATTQSVTLKIEKLDKQDKFEKIEKRKKLENTLSASVTTTTAAAITVVDILAMESLVPETAEFHVVTKKRKPKKQRTSFDETASCSNSFGSVTIVAGAGGFQQQQQHQQQQQQQRTHNFMTNNSGISGMQQQQKITTAQQQQPRYKYYNSHATNNERVDYLNSGYHNNHASVTYNHQYQPQQQQHYSSVNVNATVNNNNNNSSHQNQQQQQQQSHVVSGDSKSRRKSTSSVPPSEKSDSSDLDSVHSLPIESTSTTTTASLSSSSKSSKQQRHKNTASDGNNKNAASNNSPAPISYADIARTNKEREAAAAALSNGSDKWPAVDVANNNCNSNVAATDATTTAVTATIVDEVTPQAAPKLKAKRTTSKPDFPELVANTTTAALDVAIMKTNIFKPISYSQSLTTVPVAMNAVVSHSSDILPAAAVAANTSNETKEIRVEKRLVATTEAVAMPLSNNVANATPQQQTLQKSKSVENESYNYNSGNLDQQYPALEKTVKRHSANNVAAAIATNAAATSTQFNFAAAAKQQMPPNEATQKPTTPTTAINAAAATATTITTSSNTTSVASPPVATAAAAVVAVAKKPKEKTPNNIAPVAFVGDAALPVGNTIARKFKKEKHAPSESHTDSHKLSTATQTSVTANNSNKNRTHAQLSNNVAVKKSVTPNIAGNKIVATLANNSNKIALAASTAAANRPAVIILNDDRAIGASNEFTFGDFNEDELKFFDDEIADEEEYVADDAAIPTEAVVVATTEELVNARTPPATKSKLSPTASGTTFFNDSGASSDVTNNSTQHVDDIMLLADADASSSPNASFVVTAAGHTAAVNQSGDSGIYTQISTNTSVSSNKSKSNSKRSSPPANKLNTFLNAPAFSTTATAVKSNEQQSCLPPQQLETCNDIETAIIAAARAAAAQQQQNYQNSSSNSSSFSSSSSTSVDTKYPPQSPTAAGASVAINHHYDDKTNTPTTTASSSRSRSSSSQRATPPATATAVFVNIQRKDFEFRFIQPTMSTESSSLQHNEIIVDFIGSAWEEVANSKVTKFYDGQ